MAGRKDGATEARPLGPRERQASMQAGWQKRIALGLVPLFLCGGLWIGGLGFSARAEALPPAPTETPTESPATAETAAPAEPSDTFLPAPEPSVSPSASPAAVATETPVPPAQEPAPEGETMPAEALRVRSLYLEADTSVGPGKNVTLTLQITADNPDGTALLPFGLLLEPQGLPAWDVAACSGAKFYQQQKLWVANATVQGGKVLVGEEPLRFALAVTPFPEGGGAKEASVTLTLLDADGQHVRLTPSDSAPDIIQLALAFRLKQEATAAPDATAVPEETAPAPTATPEETAPAPDATPEETASAPTATPEETPAPTLTAPPEPTPTPAVRRRALHASIDPANLQVNDVLTLTAELSGYEGLSIGFQWQELQGEEWINLQGYTDATVNILITPENLHRAWRYLVTVQP